MTAGPRSLHETLVEMLPDAVLALDAESDRVILANAAAERLLGTTRAELTRATLQSLIRPWDIGQLERVQAELRSSGAWRGELWLRRHDGTFVPTDVNAQVWMLEGGTIVQFCCRDASARWRDEAMRQVVSHAVERLAATFDEYDALRTVATATLPGLADAALVELDPLDDVEAAAVAAFTDPGSPSWPAPTVDHHPATHTADSIRRGNALTVPLVAAGRRLGTLTLRRAGHRLWEPADYALVDELARHAAHALDKARQWSRSRDDLADRTAMVRILSTVTSDITSRGVYEIFLEEAQAAIRAEDGGGTLWDHDRGLLCPGLPKLGTQTHCAVDPRLMVSVAANERCALIENEYQKVMGSSTPAGRVGAQAVLAVPMVHQGLLMGSMSISHLTAGRRFQPRDARRLEALASTAALTLSAIHRQRTTGAQLAIREAAHLLNNDLALTMGSLDLLQLEDALPPSLEPLVETALGGLTQAADHLAQLQRISRVETCNGPLGPRLDLARSTAPAPWTLPSA
ncbi:MAG: GAF domain-containing protein [Chloroflexota bacterium]